MDGKNKLVIGALVLSVAANLLAAGFFVGRGLSHEKRVHFDRAPKVDFSLRELGKVLPDDKREELKALMKEHRKTLSRHFASMRESEVKIRDLMMAETVDRAALTAALDEHEAKMRDLHFPVRQILLDVVAGLDQETRIKLADNMFRRRFDRMGPAGGRDGDAEMPPFPGEPGAMPPPFDEEGPEGPEGSRQGPDGDF